MEDVWVSQFSMMLTPEHSALAGEERLWGQHTTVATLNVNVCGRLQRNLQQHHFMVTLIWQQWNSVREM